MEEDPVRLYAAAQLADIRDHLLAGGRRFSVGAYRFYFAAARAGYSIQRIPNFALGLAYLAGEDAWALNYPHLDNIKAPELANVPKGWVQEKSNGTNLGYVRVASRVIHRTRGTLEPERVINDINTAIIQGKNTIVGVPQATFSGFRARYEPILRGAMEDGYVDGFGNVNVERIAKETFPAVRPLFDSIPSVMGVFGELVSRFNPICVDERISAGIYLDMGSPYKLIVFDIISREQDGSMVFWDADTVEQTGLRGENVSVARTARLSAAVLESSLWRTREEGYVVKSLNGYWKFKREDVLRWERTVGYLPNILAYSVSHLFEQEFSFSKDEVLGGALKRPQLSSEIIEAVWEEARNNGVTADRLVEFYSSKRPERSVAQIREDVAGGLRDMVFQWLQLFVAPALRDAGVKMDQLWREVPRYVWFEKEPVYFDAKKGKERAHVWYSKLIGGVIGRTYF